jgi:hypothetical protein
MAKRGKTVTIADVAREVRPLARFCRVPSVSAVRQRALRALASSKPLTGEQLYALLMDGLATYKATQGRGEHWRRMAAFAAQTIAKAEG